MKVTLGGSGGLNIVKMTEHSLYCLPVFDWIILKNYHFKRLYFILVKNSGSILFSDISMLETKTETIDIGITFIKH